eukprot:m.134583 g.134583  ORF g.134583 m.134583 type:complete len:122 (-) comp29746_c0_seq1:198-563(-)
MKPTTPTTLPSRTQTFRRTGSPLQVIANSWLLLRVSAWAVCRILKMLSMTSRFLMDSIVLAGTRVHTAKAAYAQPLHMSGMKLVSTTLTSISNIRELDLNAEDTFWLKKESLRKPHRSHTD